MKRTIVPKTPAFIRSVTSRDGLERSFESIESLPLEAHDKIEVGCLHQYLAVLAHHGRVHFPLVMFKHRQGQGPDFTIRNGHYFGVEMTKVTTQDFQVWRKRGVNYWPIRSVEDYADYKPEQRVSDLAMVRIQKKNYKLPNYKAAEPEMEYCDLVLEEDGSCCMHPEVLMELLQKKVKKLKLQRFRTLSVISGSYLLYAFNTPDAEILHAPELFRVRPREELEDVSDMQASMIADWQARADWTQISFY